MKVLMKSGEKELVLGHREIYNLRKRTGVDIFDWVAEMQRFKVNATYELLFSCLQAEYESIEDMLDDIKDEEMKNYSEKLGDLIKKRFGANTTEK